MATITKDLGTATACGYAKDNGYEGTEQEFGELMASYATVADEARGYAEEAERQVGLAEDQVELATAQAQASASSATEASGYADDASESASASASSATDSATSATASETAKTQAQGYAQDAGGSASNALTYKNQAQAYASQASESASDASDSATASASSASDAEDSATASANSATASANSASDSADSALEAKGYAESIDPDTLVKKTELEETLEGYATVDGYFEDLTSGSTEEVISNVKITDQEPYTFRTSGGNAEIGSREEDTLVGVSVAFNQLVANSHKSLSYTTSETGYQLKGIESIQFEAEHLYLININADVSSNGRYRLRYPSVSADFTDDVILMRKFSSSDYLSSFSIQILSTDGNEATFSFDNIQVFDLTLAFGSDIADYLYTLEQAQAGEGVALAKKLGLNKYLGYNAGTLYSAQTDAHKMTGFNQWDEEWESGAISGVTGFNYSDGDRIRSKNYIPVLSNKTYYFKSPTNLSVRTYDANKTFLATATAANGSTKAFDSNVAYIRFMLGSSQNPQTTYNHDICISIHWDNSRDTDYEPYVLHNYPIDPVVLRGILKKDADGNIYADGDTYEADGTVTRKYGIVDLGSLNWNYVSETKVFYTFLNPAQKSPINDGKTGNAIVAGYVCKPYYAIVNNPDDDKLIALRQSDGTFRVRNLAYTDATTFKTAMSGVYLVYELAEPTTEQATPFTTPQIVDNWGTEEYPDYAVAQGDREYSVPMGHTTLYPISIRDKVEASADNPSNDGVYILQMSGGKATYIPLIIEDELPSMPTQDGTYTLKTVVSRGTATLSWVAE